jgi:hypothetical protein
MHRATRYPFTLLIALLAVGCYRAPELSGGDQVYDPNIAATAQKDNGLAALESRGVIVAVERHDPTDAVAEIDRRRQ